MRVRVRVFSALVSACSEKFVGAGHDRVSVDDQDLVVHKVLFFAGRVGVKQRSVVARSRADFEDAVTWLHVELLEHLRDDGRRGGQAARPAVRPRVGDDSVLCVSSLD